MEVRKIVKTTNRGCCVLLVYVNNDDYTRMNTENHNLCDKVKTDDDCIVFIINSTTLDYVKCNTRDIELDEAFIRNKLNSI